MARKIFMILAGLAAVWVIFSAAAAILFMSEEARTEENILIRTESEPIYNLFPDLPETSEIQWCSRSSGGIGLTTTRIYFFAFYDEDVSRELQEMKMENKEDIELHFFPDGVSKDEKWRYVENGWAAFQTGIKDSEKMYTTVYINEAGTILYVEAIGD